MSPALQGGFFTTGPPGKSPQLGFLGRKKRVGCVLELAVRSKDDTCRMSRPGDGGSWGRSEGEKQPPFEELQGSSVLRAEPGFC